MGNKQTNVVVTLSVPLAALTPDRFNQMVEGDKNEVIKEALAEDGYEILKIEEAK